MSDVINLLDADPDLGDALEREELEQAQPYLVTRVGRAEVGPWDAPRAHVPEPADLGLLVLEGLAVRELDVAGRHATELLGEGDLLRPWDPQESGPLPATRVSWRVLAPLRFAILDGRFTLVAGRWPALMAAVMARAVRRSRVLTYNLAVSQITGVETRVLLALWALAQRWGHVRPDGVVLDLRVTHETLAKLVGARRPTVTTALRVLQADNRITQERPGRWILHGSPPGEPEVTSPIASAG